MSWEHITIAGLDARPLHRLVPRTASGATFGFDVVFLSKSWIFSQGFLSVCHGILFTTLLEPGGAGSSIFDGELQDGKPPDDNGPFPEVLPSRVRAAYHLHPGGRRKGPLSVNDPELPQTPANRRSVFDSFYEIPSPFGHYDARSQWRIHYRDHIAHVHRLLRILMAAQDFAGAARCLAVLHRLHATFDPNVYRYTVNLLRLHGDHSVRKLPTV